MGSASIGFTRRLVIGRSTAALAVALAAGAAALIAPPVALLFLALLGARALVLAPPRAFSWLALAGPALAALVVGAFVGLAGAIGALFVWRLASDARWSIGEAKRLAIAAGRPGETSFEALAHAWLTPAAGLALVAYTSPHMVLGLPLDLPHVPLFAPAILAAGAMIAMFDWALKRAADWRLGELARAPAAHLLAHHIVFVLAFGLTLDVSAGLVALIAWRLAQAPHFPQARAHPSLTAVP